MEHAERNAIYNAARIGSSTLDCTLYLSSNLPCVDCARAIINAGICTVYCDDSMHSLKGIHWNEQVSRTLQMFREADVQVIYY